MFVGHADSSLDLVLPCSHSFCKSFTYTGTPQPIHAGGLLQKPFSQALGLDLNHYFLGTINVSIAPHIYKIKQAKYTFRNVRWSAEPAEDFSFFDCQIWLKRGEPYSGLIYYPHPNTKPEHFQTPDTLEIITSFIGELKYGDQVIIAVDSKQIQLD